jgi:hypothetical protein
MRTECPDCGSENLHRTVDPGGFRCDCGWVSYLTRASEFTTYPCVCGKTLCLNPREVLDCCLEAAMPPDPDPKEAMTTIPAPLILDNGKEAIIAHDAAAVANLIRRANASPTTKPYVQKAKAGEGTGTLGLYVEAVVLTGSGKPFTHMKFFVVDRNVYAYSRSAGDARANWRRREASSLRHALETVQSALERDNVKLFGHPVLVELTATDLSQVESGGIPEARFRGEYRIQKDFGRYDFNMEICSAPLPEVLVQALRKGYVTARPDAV